MNNGQSIVGLIFWITGISIPLIGGVLAWSDSKFSANEVEHTAMKVDIAVAQANYENIMITLEEIKLALKIPTKVVASSTIQRR